MFPSVKMGRICALLLNYPARPDQLRLEPFFLPPCIYLLILMSLQTALRKAREVSLPCRCEAQMWHSLAWAGSGEQRQFLQAGHLGHGHMRAQVYIWHDFCLPANRQMLQTQGNSIFTIYCTFVFHSGIYNRSSFVA